ncbi:MAG: HEPN domain-containing protein [Kiritimatiellae bacterium]|nr:HEPN domain-containing protein [Kiritimatiellia bacterium]MDD4025984.1 HEPN domain-containing protein [Kiritimatiellia bacterium]MDD4623248.1 HEPN domain-containing protein [Kiritimatiellia bacterium]
MSSNAKNPRTALWLRDAESDLALASVKKTKKIRYEHLCFHAQQAAEKALKVVLLSCDVDIPRTHDLAFLVDLLPQTLSLPPSLLLLPVLTKYAVQHRYPGQELPVNRRDYLKAIGLAQEAVAWAGHVVSA